MASIGPLDTLYIKVELPPECSQAWSRVEQRAQSMLLGALPDGLRAEVLGSRCTNSVEILYNRYQPGGLGEKSMVLRQPGNIGETLEGLRMWKRCLLRAMELGVSTPDPTLLMNALDRLGVHVSKSSPQAAFRLSSTRAILQVDVCPTHLSVVNYADTLLAEAEGVYHSGNGHAAAKIKAVSGARDAVKEKDTKDVKGGKGAEKGSADGGGKGERGPPACRFFGTDDGCEKGAACTYRHDWNNIDRKGRCWTCSSTKHSQRECTVRAMSTNEKGGTDGGGKGQKVMEKPRLRRPHRVLPQ